jgi:hypothetical protein
LAVNRPADGDDRASQRNKAWSGATRLATATLVKPARPQPCDNRQLREDSRRHFNQLETFSFHAPLAGLGITSSESRAVRLPFFMAFHTFSMVEIAILTLFVTVAFFVAGFVVDSVMEGEGFGPYWNGVIALVGLVFGLAARAMFFPYHSSYDPVLTFGVVFGVMIWVLLVLAAVRNRFS